MKGIKYIILLLTNDTLYLAAMRKMKAAATTGNGFLILIYSTFYIFFIYFFYYLFILFYFIYLILFFILFINFRVFVSCFRVVCCVFMSHIIASHKAHTTQKPLPVLAMVHCIFSCCLYTRPRLLATAAAVFVTSVQISFCSAPVFKQYISTAFAR